MKKYSTADQTSLFVSLFRRVFILFLFLAPFFLTAAGAPPSPPKRILIISTFHLTHRWTAEFNQTLQDTLHELPYRVSVDFLELNAIQRRNIDFQGKFKPYLKNIRNGDYDLLVAILGDAIELIEKNYKFFPSTLPVICVADQTISAGKRKQFSNITGTQNEWIAMKNIELGLALMPQTKEIVIITDDVDSGPFFHNILQRELRDFKRCKITLLNGKDHTTTQILEKVAALPKESFVIFTPWRNFLKDGFFSLEQVAFELEKCSPGPYLIITDVLVGKGALGGYVSHGVTHAKAAAKQIARIFSGEKPKNIPFLNCPRNLVVDMNAMRKFGLSSAKLPSEARLINRKPPFWETYRTECIIICIAFFCISALLILLLLYHLRFRKLSRTSNFLLNHGGELAQVTYLSGDDTGGVLLIGGSAENGFPNDGKKHLMEDWVVPEERERFIQLRDRIVLENLGGRNEIFHSEQNGVRRVFRLLAAGEKYADSYLIVIQDITESQVAAEAKSYFLASVSHEIRTPLNAMLGFSELLMDEDLPHEDRVEYAASIRSSGALLLDLISDVLDLAKLENGNMEIVLEETDFRVFAEEILSAFRPRVQEKHLLLECSCMEMPLIQIDRSRIRQIMVNLLGNSLKFTDRGLVRFRAEFHPKTNAVGTFTFSVSDTGRGISPENQVKIFQPFVRIDTGRGTQAHLSGTGLGLVLCRRMAENMGGGLFLESEPEKGSTVTVTLPKVHYRADVPAGE